jgi:hypothetical protein
VGGALVRIRCHPLDLLQLDQDGPRHLLRMYTLSALEPRNRKAGSMIASLVFCAVSVTAATAMDRGQFKNVPPEIREWFENMRSPKGISCCSYCNRSQLHRQCGEAPPLGICRLGKRVPWLRLMTLYINVDPIAKKEGRH